MSAASKLVFESAGAVELLSADHARIRLLFRDFERLLRCRAWAQAQAVARLICRELEIHTTVEEEIFYPEMRGMLDDIEPIKSARVEHALAKFLSEQVAAGSIHDPKFAARVRVLAQCVERHMLEEEEQMFKRARMEVLNMQEIGARIEARKLDLRSELDARHEAGGTPARESSGRRAGFVARRVV